MRFLAFAPATPGSGGRDNASLGSAKGAPGELRDRRGFVNVGSFIAACALGFVAGVIARAPIPNDAFRHMHGMRSWLTSLGLGLLGALVGYGFSMHIWHRRHGQVRLGRHHRRDNRRHDRCCRRVVPDQALRKAWGSWLELIPLTGLLTTDLDGVVVVAGRGQAGLSEFGRESLNVAVCSRNCA